MSVFLFYCVIRDRQPPVWPRNWTYLRNKSRSAVALTGSETNTDFKIALTDLTVVAAP